jgi:putative ABC transport system substrate-binding protein
MVICHMLGENFGLEVTPMLARLAFIIVMISAMLAGCRVAGDGASDLTVVGIINAVPMRQSAVDAFIASMAAYGYIDGESVSFRYEGALPDAEARRQWINALLATDVDLIVAVTTPAAMSAVEATTTTPILFFPVTDPVGAGLVDTLDAPGRNATGITNGNPHPLRLQLLLELDPSIKTIYAPYTRGSVPAESTRAALQETATALGVEMLFRVIESPDEIDRALEDIPDGVDAIFTMPDPFVANRWADWSRIAVERSIPFSSLSQQEVENGVLMAYGEEMDSIGAQAARMADVILRGTAPADLPVERADYFLAINLQTAMETSLRVPDSLLRRANLIVYPTGADH